MKYFNIEYKFNVENRINIYTLLIKCEDVEVQNRINYSLFYFKNQCLFDLGYIVDDYETKITYYTETIFNAMTKPSYQEIVVDNINPETEVYIP